MGWFFFVNEEEEARRVEERRERELGNEVKECTDRRAYHSLYITKLGRHVSTTIFKNKRLWRCRTKRQGCSVLSFAEKGRGEETKKNGKEKV